MREWRVQATVYTAGDMELTADDVSRGMTLPGVAAPTAEVVVREVKDAVEREGPMVRTRPPAPAEQAKFLARMCEKGHSAKDLAPRLGISTSYVRSLVTCWTRATDAVRDAWLSDEGGYLSVDRVYVLTQAPPEGQDAAIAWLRTGPRKKDVTRYRLKTFGRTG